MAATLSELLVRLGVDSADFRSGLEKARKDADGFGKRMDAIGSKIRNVFAGLTAGLTAGALFKGIIQNTIEAENALAQLNSVIKSTGGAAGITAADVLSLSQSLQKVTTFSDEAITEAQTLLLTIGGLSKAVLPQATEAVLNLATAMGSDTKTAALQLGKAMKDPIDGLTALQKAGVKFTDGQKAAIAQLVETGQEADALNLVIEKLNETMGGRARDAADTFGGSLAQLKNAFGDLLEGGGGSLEDAKKSIQELTDLLRDEQTKEGIALIATGVFRLAEGLAKVASFAGGAAKGAGEFIAKLDIGTGSLEKLALATALLNPITAPFAIQRILGITAGGGGGKQPGAIGLEGVPDLAALGTLPPIVDLKPRKTGRHGAEKVSEIQRETDALQKQIALYGDLTKSDEVRIGLAKGYYGLVTPAQALRLQQYADELTALTAQTKAEEDYRKVVKEREDAEAEAIVKRDEALQDGLDEIERLLRTEEEAIYESYRRRLDIVQAAVDQGIIIQSKGTEISFALLDKMNEELNKKGDEMTEFAKAAAQEIQGAFAEFLFDPWRGGLDGMLADFGKFLQKAIAQAAAAQILKAIGGYLGGSSNSFLSAIGGAFGGGKADGGPVSAGTPYLVGERGPELFMPNQSGKIVPNDAGGAVNVHNTFMISEPASRKTQEQVTNAAYRGTLRAARRGGA